MLRVYLDTCCLNRPFDDQTQDRIHLETEAILLVLRHFQAGEWQWIGSKIVGLEIAQTPDPERRHRVTLLASHMHYSVLVEQRDVERAQQLEILGFHAFDALHIACAERCGVDVLLTTDDRFLRLASRLLGHLHVQIRNPLSWLREVTEP